MAFAAPRPHDEAPDVSAAEAVVSHTFLRERRDAILREWEALACAAPRAVKLAGAALRGHVPELVDELARWMEGGDDPPSAATLCPGAVRHAMHRLVHSVPLAQFLDECTRLREAIVRELLRDEGGEQGTGGAARERDRCVELARLGAGMDAVFAHAAACFVAGRDRRRAEQRAARRARRAKPRHGSLAQLSPDAILVHRDGRIVFANPSSAVLFGARSAQDLVGRSPLELVHPDDHALVREGIRSLLDGDAGPNPRTEVTIVRLDGETRRVDASAAAFDDAGGKAIEAVLRDVTERRRAEEALRTSEERLRAHIDNSPLAVVEFDPQFTVTRWSKEAERLFGWTAGEIIGRSVEEVRWVHEDDLESVRRESARLSSGEGTRTVHANRNYRKDGAIVHCEWYSSALRDGRGCLISILSQVLDVTDRKRAEEALRAADRRKTEFLAVLSHELRNHLAPIGNCLRLLERSPPGSPPFDRAREVIASQMDHMTRLVDDLLEISRINTGRIRLERARLDARDVVRRACAGVRAMFEERGVALDVALAGEPLWVDADEVRLTQVVANLLGNALKFTPAAGAVHVEARRERCEIELRVRDTGAGIEPALLGEIFEPFVQAERTRGTSRGGMGIGLALARRLVNMHGGTIRARSEGEGKGAELIVSLPLARRHEAEVAARAPAAARAPGAALPRSLAILLVEDDRDAAETLGHLLELEGHRTRLAFDGRSALEVFRDLAPDVLIADVALPDLDGHEVVRTIRGLEGGRAVFAIALTGYAQADDVERAREAGFDAHLPKPARLERLDALLAEAASRTEAARGAPLPERAPPARQPPFAAADPAAPGG
jgi:PAS domain S-box-containing protein